MLVLRIAWTPCQPPVNGWVGLSAAGAGTTSCPVLRGSEACQTQALNLQQPALPMRLLALEEQASEDGCGIDFVSLGVSR